MDTSSHARLRIATMIAALVAALVVPLAVAPSATGSPLRCLDFELVTPYDAVYDFDSTEGPFFDVAVTPTVQVQIQVTDGDGGAFQEGGVDDVEGTFDCPGTPLAGQVVSISENSGGTMTVSVPADATTVAGGLTPLVDITNTNGGYGDIQAQLEVSDGQGGSTLEYTDAFALWGVRGLPVIVECEPPLRTNVQGETRTIVARVTDSWFDPVAGVDLDITHGTSDANDDDSGFLADAVVSDADGEVSTSYVATNVGQDRGACRDTAQTTEISNNWRDTTDTAENIASADLEVDANYGNDPLAPASTPYDTFCFASNFSMNDPAVGDEVADGLGNNTDDEIAASRVDIPVNSVVDTCIGAYFTAGEADYVNREATLTIAAGPGQFVSADGTPLGASTTFDAAEGRATAYLTSTEVGTTTVVGTIDGVTDTDTVTFEWVTSAAEARVLECEADSPWTTLPDTFDATCTVTDGLGNPVPFVPVSWETDDRDGADSSGTFGNVTDAFGEVSVELQSSAEGITDVTVAVNTGDCDPPAETDGPDGFDLGKPAASCVFETFVRWSDDAPPTDVDLDTGTGGTGDGETLDIVITDDDGSPVDGVLVCVVVTGANAGSYQGTSDDDGNVSIALPTTVAGDDVIEVYADLDGDGTCDETAVLSESLQRNLVQRFAGSDRILTAVLASQERFADHAGNAVRSGSAAQDQSAAAVVVARADLFADALAGTPLAAANSAPLLLSFTGELAPATLAEVDRVLPDGGTVHLLGGEAALAPAVADALAARWNVNRIGGANRYETAVQIAQSTTATPGQILVTTGTVFPDALTAGAAAAKVGGVVVLSGDGTPTTATTEYLASLPTVTAVAVGGPASRAYPSLASLVGSNRFATGLAVAEAYFDGPTEVGIARGYNFPDGLSGGAHIGNLGGPLLLVRGVADVEGLEHPDNVAVAQYLADNAGSLSTAYVYGGAAAVAEVFTDQLADAIS